MPDSVCPIKIDSLLAQTDPQTGRPSEESRGDLGTKALLPTDAVDESWHSFDESPWEGSEEVDLLEVV
jgi:hypothetical protein